MIYKEWLKGFKEGFTTDPNNLMLMMKLKVVGKSDSEIAELWSWGIKSFNVCMFRQVHKRFPEDQLNEWQQKKE